MWGRDGIAALGNLVVGPEGRFQGLIETLGEGDFETRPWEDMECRFDFMEVLGSVI